MGDHRPNVLVVTDKSASDLDNVAIDKYSQKVGWTFLIRGTPFLIVISKGMGGVRYFLVVISPFRDASTQGLGPYKKGMANLHGDVRCDIYSVFIHLPDLAFVIPQLILASLRLAKNRLAVSTLHGNVRYSTAFRFHRNSIVAL